MSIKHKIKFKDNFSRLKPSQVMSNYKDIPADLRYTLKQV